MQCTECEREVPEGSAFCPHCGAKAATGGGKSPASSPPRAPEAAQFTKAVGRGSGGSPAEQDLWSGTYSPQAMIGQAAGLLILTVLGFIGGAIAGGVLLIVAAIVAVALWALLGLVLLYRRMTVQYRLTTFRLFHESGLLSRKRDRIEVIDINDVTLHQGIIERMFNVGTIHIDSSDKSHPDFDMPGIDNVRQVSDLIDNTRRAERQRRAVFMENVGGGPANVG